MANNRKIYISGPMRGVANYKLRFDLGETYINTVFKDSNPEIINPAKIELPAGKDTYEDYIRFDINELLKCDTIVMLKNWEQSTGARAEHAVAVALSLDICYI